MKEIKKNPLHWIFPCKLYPTDENLLIGLANEETAAIRCLLMATKNSVSKMLSQLGLPNELLEEIQHDGMLILLNKIKSNQFKPGQSSPKTYLLSICKNHCLNASRLKHHQLTDSLDVLEEDLPSPDDSESHLPEKVKFMTKLLDELGSPCKELISFKYILELSDEEQIQSNQTAYKNVNSLRVSRSQCMKKLVALSLKYKSSYAQL